MASDAQRLERLKSMAFDLFAALDDDPSKQTYTREEVKNLIKNVITAEQK